MPDSTPRHLRGPMMGRQRNATTLVEVLGTLSVLLVLGVSAASILGSITQVGARSNRAMHSRASVERLAKVFRQDIHQASEIVASDAPMKLELSTQSVTVRYQWRAKLKSIWRTVSEGEKRLSFDTFELADGLQPVVSVTDDLVVLRLNDRERAGAHGRQWIIEARR